MVYGDFKSRRRRKNKAKQSQYKASPELVEWSQFAWEAEPAQAIPKACGFEAATRPNSDNSGGVAGRLLPRVVRETSRKDTVEKTKPIFAGIK